MPNIKHLGTASDLCDSPVVFFSFHYAACISLHHAFRLGHGYLCIYQDPWSFKFQKLSETGLIRGKSSVMYLKNFGGTESRFSDVRCLPLLRKARLFSV